MATHDYVIANGTGAAVRSDLNNALAAIVSNNSGSSAPSTTYAYQWWADTNNNVLKIRNSANNAWITLRELDGTLLMEDGSASTPGLAFADDVNTGIFSPAADQIGFATGGAERLEIGSSEVVFNDPSNDVDFRVESNGNTHMLFVDAGNDRVGIGESSPDRKLHINSGATDTALKVESTDSEVSIELTDNAGSAFIGGGGNYLNFYAGGNERARIDSSGRLLVGATSPIFDNTNAKVQIAADAGGTLAIGRNDTSVTAGNGIGLIRFYGNDDSGYEECARIAANADGTHANGDKPTRLEFLTTADGGSSPTEQLRINSNGDVLFKQEAASNFPQQKLKWSNDSTTANGFYISQNDDRNGVIFHEQGLDILFGTNNTERMRIDSSGNVGIGNSSPGRKLHIHDGSGSSAQTIQIDSGGVGLLSIQSGTTSESRIEFGDSSNDDAGYIYYENDNDVMKFGINASERMRVNSSGNFMVGQTNGSSGTVGIVCNANGLLTNCTSNTDASVININNLTGAKNLILFRSDGTNRGSIETNGSTVTYNTTSDYRVKENVVDIDGAIDRVKQLLPKRFNFISHPERTVDGFLAHEAQTVVPEAVTGTHNEVDDDGNAVMQGIDQSKLVPLLTAALQEAIAKIETLETKVAALEAG